MQNALVMLDPPAPPAELTATLELAADFARASKAKTTLAAYESDWRVFESWCGTRGLVALPACRASWPWAASRNPDRGRACRGPSRQGTRPGRRGRRGEDPIHP